MKFKKSSFVFLLLFSFNLFICLIPSADEISDLQAEIDRLGFKWKAGWTSLLNLKEEEKEKLNCLICDSLENNFPLYQVKNSNSNLSQKLHPYTSIKNQKLSTSLRLLLGTCCSCCYGNFNN